MWAAGRRGECWWHRHSSPAIANDPAKGPRHEPSHEPSPATTTHTILRAGDPRQKCTRLVLPADVAAERHARGLLRHGGWAGGHQMAGTSRARALGAEGRHRAGDARRDVGARAAGASLPAADAADPAVRSRVEADL